LKSFDSIEVLNIPRLEIEKGEPVGVAGNNGAGKNNAADRVYVLENGTVR
jgi:ABC-type sugar transport system ATPase subunit